MRYGCYEVTCPYHIRSKLKKSLCKKVFRAEGPTVQHKEEAIRKARVWAVQAVNYKYQRQHVFECSVDQDWSFATLEEMRADLGMNHVPGDIQDDEELCQAEPDIEKQRLRGGGKGCGQGRGRPKGLAKPKPNIAHAHSGAGQQAGAAESRPLAGGQPGGQTSSSSSNSSSSSS